MSLGGSSDKKMLSKEHTLLLLIILLYMENVLFVKTAGLGPVSSSTVERGDF
jgi:hypothetical protein